MILIEEQAEAEWWWTQVQIGYAAIICINMYSKEQLSMILAAMSSSRSDKVTQLVCPSVCWTQIGLQECPQTNKEAINQSYAF